MGGVFDAVGDFFAGVDDFVNDVTWRNQAKAKKAAERQYQLQRQAETTRTNYQKYNNRLQRLQQIREARMRRAQALSQGFASGVGAESSNVQGVLGSLGTQVATNEAKVLNADTLGNYLSGLNQEIGYQNYLFNKAQMNQQSQLQMLNLGMGVGKTVIGGM